MREKRVSPLRQTVFNDEFLMMNDEPEVRLQQALALAQIGRFSDQLIPSGANRRQCEGRGDDEIMKG